MPDLLQILSTTQPCAQPYALVVDDHPLVAEGAAHVLMTSAGEILEVFGDCSPFLAIRKGKADFNAFALIKPPFRAELRAFAHRVGRTRQSAVCNPIKLPIEGTARHFRMAVHYCGDLDTHDSSLLLVCFESADAWPGTADGSDANPGTNERILELEHEIERAIVVDSRQVAQDVVTMNSKALLRVDDEELEVALVYPEDADDGAGKLSVCSGIGTAILGYKEGDAFSWRMPHRTCHIRIGKVLYQPEAAGDFHL